MAKATRPIRFPAVLRSETAALLQLARERGQECQARQPGLILSIEQGSELDTRRDGVLQACLDLRKEHLSPQEAQRRLSNALAAAARGDDHEKIVEQLVSFFTSQPLAIVVYVPIAGISPECLPLDFGGVQFRSTKGDDGERVLAQVDDPNWRAALRKSLLEQNACMAQVTQSALDDALARARALSRIRDAVDALNFFGPLVAGPTEMDSLRRSIYGARVHLLTDGSPRHFQVLSVTPASQGATVANHGRSRADAWFPRCGDQQATQLGLDRIGALLESAPDRGVAARILRAVKLIGRANAEIRDDEAMLFYVTALEALVVDGKGELTYKTAMNIAALFEDEYRRWAFDTVKDAYDARSRLVHGGTTSQNDDLLDSTRQIATASTHSMLRHFGNENASDQTLHAWLRERFFPTTSST